MKHSLFGLFQKENKKEHPFGRDAITLNEFITKEKVQRKESNEISKSFEEDVRELKEKRKVDFIESKENQEVISIFDKIINSVLKDLFVEDFKISEKAFYYFYLKNNKYFHPKDINSIEKYLNSYFKNHKNNFFLAIRKNYRELNRLFSELYKLTNKKINSCDEFIKLGRSYLKNNKKSDNVVRKEINSQNDLSISYQKHDVIKKENTNLKELFKEEKNHLKVDEIENEVEYQKDLNYLFDKVINVVSNHLFKRNIGNSKNAFKYYKDSYKYLNVKERNKIKKYLTRYFKLRNNPFYRNNKTYLKLNKILNRITIKTHENFIDSYKEFRYIGEIHYKKINTKPVTKNVEESKSFDETKNIQKEVPKVKMDELSALRIIYRDLSYKLVTVINKLQELEKSGKEPIQLNKIKNQINCLDIILKELHRNIEYLKLNRDAIREIDEISLKDYLWNDQIAYVRDLEIDIDSFVKRK